MLKIMKNDKIVGAVEEWSDRDKRFHPDVVVVEDTEHTPTDYTNIGEEFVLNTDPRAVEYKQNRVREIRNSYLEQYVDPVISNQIRFSEMSETDKEKILNYRRYLLDYTNNENWWQMLPLDWENWNK